MYLKNFTAVINQAFCGQQFYFRRMFFLFAA